MPESSEHFHKKLSFPQLVNLSLAAFLLLGIAVTSYNVNSLREGEAEAARGGGKGKQKYTCNVTLSTTTPTLGSTIVVSGSGFNAYQQVSVIQSGAGYGMFADANGNFTLTIYSGALGSNSITVEELIVTTKGSRQTGEWVECWSGSYEVVN